MTIKVRNSIFISGLTTAGILFILFILGSIFLLYSYNIPVDSLIDPTSLIINLSIVTILLLYALISGIILLYSFRKTSSPEAFYLIIFLLLFTFEGLRLGLIYVQEAGLPFETGRTVSRGIYFGRILGTVCLFLSGLFACGIRNQRLEILLGIGFLISLTLSVTIPLDSRSTDFNLVYANGLEDIFFIGFLIIKLLGIWNYFYAGIINNNRNYYVIGLGIFMITAGKDLICNFQDPIFTLSGLGLLITGTAIFGTRMHKIYLWF